MVLISTHHMYMYDNRVYVRTYVRDVLPHGGTTRAHESTLDDRGTRDMNVVRAIAAQHSTAVRLEHTLNTSANR